MFSWYWPSIVILILIENIVMDNMIYAFAIVLDHNLTLPNTIARMTPLNVAALYLLSIVDPSLLPASVTSLIEVSSEFHQVADE